MPGTDFIEETALRIRRKMADDPHRPGYHFLPPINWMNDPNGPIQFEGQFHIFYQSNPYSAAQRSHPVHWGHAVSDDLVYWKDMPHAISPTPWGVDYGGCWSGNVVNNNGVPTMVYLGVGSFTAGQCLATSRDGMITWQKHPDYVVSAPPDLEGVSHGGDPFVWRGEDTWYMLVSGHIKGRGGTALLYRSQDLIKWEYLNPLIVGEASETGEHWEIPNLFTLDGRDVFVVSRGSFSIGFIGRFAEHEFVPESGPFRIDLGEHYYAATVFVDDSDRRIMFAWCPEGRSVQAQIKAEWAGVMSLPRVLSMRADGSVGYEPAAELESLRRKHFHFEQIRAKPSGSDFLPDVKGDMLEIIAEIDPGDAESVGLRVLCSPDGREETVIFYDRKKGKILCDRLRASLDPATTKSVDGGEFELADGEPLRLLVFVDRSIIEIFANGRACLTQRVYPTKPDSKGVAVFAEGGSATLKTADIWQLEPIWPIRVACMRSS